MSSDRVYVHRNARLIGCQTVIANYTTFLSSDLTKISKIKFLSLS